MSQNRSRRSRRRLQANRTWVWRLRHRWGGHFGNIQISDVDGVEILRAKVPRDPPTEVLQCIFGSSNLLTFGVVSRTRFPTRGASPSQGHFPVPRSSFLGWRPGKEARGGGGGGGRGGVQVQGAGRFLGP